MANQPFIHGEQYQRVFTENTPLIQYIDDDGAGTIFVCEALSGSETSETVWRIKQIVEVGGLITTGYPNGDNSFSYSVDLRETYTYG